MKREIKREKVLPSFEIDLGQLGALWERCIALAGEEKGLYYSNVRLELKNETLKFEKFEELKSYEGLPDRITKFSLWIRNGDRHISLSSSTIFWTRPEIRAEGESEAWCAGAVESVHSFLSGYKTWYNTLVVAPLGWFLAGLLCAVPAALAIVQKLWVPEYQLPRVVVTGWVGSIVALALLYVSRASLFPLAVLKVRETRGFIRRNVAELSLFVALLSALISIVGWFVGK